MRKVATPFCLYYILHDSTFPFFLMKLSLIGFKKCYKIDSTVSASLIASGVSRVFCGGGLSEYSLKITCQLFISRSTDQEVLDVCHF
jgi:hypothetical protein